MSTNNIPLVESSQPTTNIIIVSSTTTTLDVNHHHSAAATKFTTSCIHSLDPYPPSPNVQDPHPVTPIIPAPANHATTTTIAHSSTYHQRGYHEYQQPDEQ